MTVTLGRSKGYQYQGVIELTCTTTFREEQGDSRVFWNSPAPVTVGRSEGIQGVIEVTGASGARGYQDDIVWNSLAPVTYIHRR